MPTRCVRAGGVHALHLSCSPEPTAQRWQCWRSSPPWTPCGLGKAMQAGQTIREQQRSVIAPCRCPATAHQAASGSRTWAFCSQSALGPISLCGHDGERHEQAAVSMAHNHQSVFTQGACCSFIPQHQHRPGSKAPCFLPELARRLVAAPAGPPGQQWILH